MGSTPAESPSFRAHVQMFVAGKAVQVAISKASVAERISPTPGRLSSSCIASVTRSHSWNRASSWSICSCVRLALELCGAHDQAEIGHDRDPTTCMTEKSGLHTFGLPVHGPKREVRNVPEGFPESLQSLFPLHPLLWPRPV